MDEQEFVDWMRAESERQHFPFDESYARNEWHWYQLLEHATRETMIEAMRLRMEAT